MTIRHDARKVREDAKSQRIRLGLGLYTPAERQAHADAEKRRLEAAKKKAQAGVPLDLEES